METPHYENFSTRKFLKKQTQKTSLIVKKLFIALNYDREGCTTGSGGAQALQLGQAWGLTAAARTG